MNNKNFIRHDDDVLDLLSCQQREIPGLPPNFLLLYFAMGKTPGGNENNRVLRRFFLLSFTYSLNKMSANSGGHGGNVIIRR